jgi:hypothetical protein
MIEVPLCGGLETFVLEGPRGALFLMIKVPLCVTTVAACVTNVSARLALPHAGWLNTEVPRS